MRGDFSRLTFDPKKRYSGVWMQQGRVQLDSDWNEQQAINRHRIESECQDTVGRSGAPFEDPGFEIRADSGNLLIGSGRYYVDGILCENDDNIKYQGQPDLPDAPDIQRLLSGADYGIVYLDAWHRDITAVDDPQIKENALGGADTTTRSKIVWQVKVLPVKLAPGQPQQEGDIELFSKNNVLMNARLRSPEPFNDPCILMPTSSYHGLENQLYRVEIHKGGPLGEATFKWSKDNGSIEIPIDSVNGSQVTIRNPGEGFLNNFIQGTLVEIVDDSSELQSQPRTILEVIKYSDAHGNIINLNDSSGLSGKLKHGRLRRWDKEVKILDGGWISLGDEGIEVMFSVKGDSRFSPGDYWLIPARVATGELEWPFDENTAPQPQPPMNTKLGAMHHYSPLAKITISDSKINVEDCRRIFPPLSGPPSIHITGTNWRNDDNYLLGDLFMNGLKVYLDRTPDIKSINSDTMIVSVEAQDPNDKGATNLSWILEGDSTVNAKTINWSLKGQMSPVTNSIYTQLSEAIVNRNSPLRLRVTLKGHLIWSFSNKRLIYLDGQSFGMPVEGDDRIDLIFPSGNCAKASDFESWCNLTEGRLPNVLNWMYKNGFSDEKTMRNWCSANYINFWTEMARTYAIWFKKWDADNILDDDNRPIYKWFGGGKCNAAYNAVDRYANGDIANKEKIAVFDGISTLMDRYANINMADKPAYIFVPEPTNQAAQRITYGDLAKSVNKFANGLKSLGVVKGDTVTIFMPMIPETPIAMLACAKIGAIHSVVFTRFSSDDPNFDDLIKKIQDSQSKILVTTDGYFRRGKPILLKPNVDKALEGAGATSIKNVVVVKRINNDVPWNERRDVWYDKLIVNQSDDCKYVEMDSEDRLFILYTSKLNGIAHTHGEYCVAPQQTMDWVFDINEEDVWWCTSDIGSIVGHSYVVYGPLGLGVTSILYEGAQDYPDINRWITIIRDCKVSKFYSESTSIRTLMDAGNKLTIKKDDVSILRILGSYGRPLDIKLYRWYWTNLGSGKYPVMDTFWVDGSGTFVISPLPLMKLMLEPHLPGSPTLPLPGFNVDICDNEGNSIITPDKVNNLVITKPWLSLPRNFPNDPKGDYIKKRYWNLYWDKRPHTYYANDQAKKDKDGNIWISQGA